jgi:endonuclease/exonuclease/phosphatase family metal-dependent hydrolase
MRLITLNIWGGRIHSPLFKFLERNKDKTDIFTFQEVFKSHKNLLTHGSYSNILSELIKALPEFNFYFASTAKNHDTRGKVNIPLEFGQATFVKKDLKVSGQGSIFVYKKYNQIDKYHKDGRLDFPRLLIYTEIESQNNKFMILNIHGYWEPAPKYDTQERFEQSQKIIDFVNEKRLPSIIAGDFNLRIETKALKMFEESGFRNLIKESKALTTRSTLYKTKWRSFDKYADYILTSKGIWVTDFKVLRAKVSDHLPLFLKFEV